MQYQNSDNQKSIQSYIGSIVESVNQKSQFFIKPGQSAEQDFDAVNMLEKQFKSASAELKLVKAKLQSEIEGQTDIEDKPKAPAKKSASK